MKRLGPWRELLDEARHPASNLCRFGAEPSVQAWRKAVSLNSCEVERLSSSSLALVRPCLPSQGQVKESGTHDCSPAQSRWNRVRALTVGVWGGTKNSGALTVPSENRPQIRFASEAKGWPQLACKTARAAKRPWRG